MIKKGGSKVKKALSIILSLVFLFISISAYAATMGEKNALASAQTYLEIMNFSYQGIISMLEYDGYTEAECKYAADNCGADWNEQAVGSARTYLSIMSFSRSGMIEMLEYDGYTSEQAEYAASIIYEETPAKPSALPSPTQEPTQKSEMDTSNSNAQDYKEVKTVTVPVGDYVVGEDIPAGSYTLTASKYSVLRVYKNQKSSYYDDSYEVEKPSFLVGKVNLQDGMMVQVVYAPMDFSTYTGIDGIDSLQATGEAIIPMGDYIVGEDIPEGDYTLSSDKYSVLRVYKDSNSSYYDNSYELEKPDFIVGKVSLKYGMKVQVVYGSMVLSKYSKLTCFDDLAMTGHATIPVGDYIVGIDIPEGTYSLTSTKYSVLRTYKNQNSSYYDNSYECEKPDFNVGKVKLTEGMFIQIVYASMDFKPYQGLGF